jgi:hypothetical protein
MAKPGRNSPCPCGSGKKYKVCCLAQDEAREREETAPNRAAEKALAWLSEHYPEELDESVENQFCAVLEDAQLEELRELPDEIFEMFQINALEWVLAEGEIELGEDDESLRFIDLVLDGADLDPHERRYLELLSTQPLDLYEVDECEPGKGIQLVSTVAASPQGIFVHEATASRSLAAGDIVAARVIPLERPVLSGAIYRFPRPEYLRLRADILEGPRDPGGDVVGSWISDLVVESWLGLLVGPPPTVTDASTGEPIALTTIDYRLEDWEGLVETLSREPGVEHDAEAETFEWVVDGADGIRRTKWIVVRSADDRIHLDARTKALADEGEKRLLELAPGAITRLGSETVDPRRLWKERHRRGQQLSERGPRERLSGEERTRLIGQLYRQIHARWADEPVPVLRDRTPREAIQDEAGLEDVVELLRSYEIGERQRAEREGREPVDFLFLWESLGLDRSEHSPRSGSSRRRGP